ncbi:MAG: hypothetical protein ACKVIY_16420 [Acidimicrobiales bacterium]|jgi:hypothetical protein
MSTNSAAPQRNVHWAWPKQPTKEHRKILRKRLGTEPVWPVEVPDHPVIFINGRVHAATWTHLSNRARTASGSRDTAEKAARHLCTYIDFLVNERGLWHEDQSRSDVMVATTKDWRAFSKKHVNGPDAVPDRRWNEMNNVVQN